MKREPVTRQRNKDVGYDVEFVQIPVDSSTTFPVPADAARRLRKKAVLFDDPAAVSSLILQLEGAKPALDDGIDYLGRGLSYARLFVRKDGIHVDNNLNGAELLKLYGKLYERYRQLLIFDLQSGQLHDATSYKEWWSRPL
jgi:hypothetical protein